MDLPLRIGFSALGVALAGLFWRAGRWFAVRIGPENRGQPTVQILLKTMGAVRRAVFSARFMRILRAMLWEIMLQGHLLRRDWRRGMTHLMLFYGFLFLLLFHVLDDFTVARLWADDNATQNPWRFLRNLAGALMLTGVCFAAVRRRSEAILRATRTAADRLALAIPAVMLLSGFLLESSQIVSPAIFNAMVEDYLFSDEPREVEALQLYWQAEFGAAALTSIPETEALALGREMHDAFCAACHDRPQSAFVSYPLSRLIKPLAHALDRFRFETVVWYLHFLAACLGLALLPHTKFFHLVTTPLSLLVRAAGSTAATAAELRPVRRALGLDACTHCGLCSQHCSVAVIYRARPNPAILPSEKIEALKRWAAGSANISAAAALAEGSYICTDCGRCTRMCPSGIDLQDLWQASRADLIRRGFPPAHSWIRSRSASAWAAGLPAAPRVAPRSSVQGISAQPETFRNCVQCTVCTNVCPVVAVSENPGRELDLTPQQVMKLLRLQLRELALGARMVWDCATCYQCQENCPQGIRVADILYELRHEAVRRLRPEFPVKAPEASGAKG